MVTNNPVGNFIKPQKIKKDIFVLSNAVSKEETMSVPSMLIDNEEIVLFGTSQSQDFFRLVPAIQSISPISNLKYIVLPSIDSQLVPVMSLFSNAGLNPTIVTTKTNLLFAKKDSLKLPIYYLEDHQNRLKLASGRTIEFIDTPFMPRPGAFVSYDGATKTLFSGPLFDTESAFPDAKNDSGWIDELIKITQMIVPSNRFLNPFLDKISRIGVDTIITGTGKVTFQDRLNLSVPHLMKLEFGTIHEDFRTNKTVSNFHDYGQDIGLILEELILIFGVEKVKKTFEGSILNLDSTGKKIDSGTLSGPTLWNLFFDTLYSKQGLMWLSVVEGTVKALAVQHDIAIPDLYASVMIETEQKSKLIIDEKHSMEKKINALENQLESTVDRLMKDPLTHAYNELFLKEYLADDLTRRQKEGFNVRDIALIYVNIDNILRLNAKYSKEIGDETIQNLGYLLNQMKRENNLVFKRNAPGFIYYAYLDDISAMELALSIQNAVKDSNAFIEKVTVSMSIVKLSEFSVSDLPSNIVAQMMSLGENRIKVGAIKGTNVITDEKSKIEKSINGKILIIDDEKINLSLLKTMFYNQNFDVMTALDGKEAFEIATNYQFDAIICERNIPRIDGIALKLALNDITLNAKTMYVLLTYNKNKEIVLRANQLGVDYVMQKPILFEELLGFIQRSIKSRGMNG
jgi:two-component system, cell cycle response regulator